MRKERWKNYGRWNGSWMRTESEDSLPIPACLLFLSFRELLFGLLEGKISHGPIHFLCSVSMLFTQTDSQDIKEKKTKKNPETPTNSGDLTSKCICVCILLWNALEIVNENQFTMISLDFLLQGVSWKFISFHKPYCHASYVHRTERGKIDLCVFLIGGGNLTNRMIN